MMTADLAKEIIDMEVSDMKADLLDYLVNVCGGQDVLDFRHVSDDSAMCFRAAADAARSLRQQYLPLGPDAPEVIAKGVRVIITAQKSALCPA